MGGSLSRRQLFALFRPGAAPAPPPAPPEWLPGFCRPPGAIAPARFAERCDACGACVEACPEGAILRLGPAYAGLEGTPAVLPEGGPCRLCSDLPCAAACPTGALEVVAPAAVKLGTARWSDERCWTAMGQVCDYCVTACPLPEPAIAVDGAAIEVDEQRCTGCGLCAYYCAATPKALAVAPTG